MWQVKAIACAVGMYVIHARGPMRLFLLPRQWKWDQTCLHDSSLIYKRMSLGIDHDVPYQLQEEPGRIMITHKGSLINQF